MSKRSYLKVTLEDSVLRVVIDRPEKRNALSREVLEELRETFTRYADRSDLKVAVLRGAQHKSFAAGGDLRDLSTVRTRPEATDMADRAKVCLDAIRSFPVPVVAALNGDALGGGAELAVACDLRVAAAHARIGFVQGKLNISTAWGGGIDLMLLIGPARGLRLLASSALLDAESAHAMGLVDAVAGTDQDIDALIDEFIQPCCGQTPQVLRAFKALAHGARSGLPRRAMEQLETKRFVGTWIQDDHWAAADRLLNSPR